MLPNAAGSVTGITVATVVQEYVDPAVVCVVGNANAFCNSQNLFGDSKIPEALLSLPKTFCSASIKKFILLLECSSVLFKGSHLRLQCMNLFLFLSDLTFFCILMICVLFVCFLQDAQLLLLFH